MYAKPQDPDFPAKKIDLGPVERYWAYVEKGVPDSAVVEWDRNKCDQLANQIILKCHIDKNAYNTKLLTGLPGPNKIEILKNNLLQEIAQDHQLATKRAVVDYILMDPMEQIRMRLPWKPHLYESRIARAPVPWHENIVQATQTIQKILCSVNPMMLEIVKLWEPYNKETIVDMSVFDTADGKILIDEFGVAVRNQCSQFRNKLMNE